MSFLSIIARAVAASIAFFRGSPLQRSKSARQSQNSERVNLAGIEVAPLTGPDPQEPALDFNAARGSVSGALVLESARAVPYSAEENVAVQGTSSPGVSGGQPGIAPQSGDRDLDRDVQPVIAIAGELVSTDRTLAAPDVEAATLPDDTELPDVKQDGSVPEAAPNAGGDAQIHSASTTGADQHSGEEEREARFENAVGLGSHDRRFRRAGDADHNDSEYEEQKASRDTEATSSRLSSSAADDDTEMRESAQAILPSADAVEMAGDTTGLEAPAAAFAPHSAPALGTDAAGEVRAPSHALSAAILDLQSLGEGAICVTTGPEDAAKADILSNRGATELTEDQSEQIGLDVATPICADAVDAPDEVRLREAEYAPAKTWVEAEEGASALPWATAANSVDNLMLAEQNADIGIPVQSCVDIASKALAEDPRGDVSEDGAFPGVPLEKEYSESRDEPALGARSLRDTETLPGEIASNHARVADDHHIDADSNARDALESAGGDRVVDPPAAKPSRRVSAYRDRRGERRAPLSPEEPPSSRSSSETAVPSKPGELNLRLSLNPIRRTVVLSMYLNRPEGFGERIALGPDNFCGEQHVQAYDQRRYDDVDVSWTPQLLNGELRVKSLGGYRWVRSSRRVHLFAEDLAEPGLISVGGATRGVLHAVVCQTADVAAVSEIAASTGSPQLDSHPNWLGIPDGWAVLSGFRPMHEATIPVGATLTSLDPMAAIEIRFDGLGLRNGVFAEGRAPRIRISELPEGTSVTIGDRPASICVDGGWEAPGWDAPGARVVDVVPGPSASYEIVQDPWRGDGWTFWDAHPERFGQDAPTLPWAGAEICGASVRAPGGREIIAVETRPTVIALGLKGGFTPLIKREDLGVSVGAIAEPAAFLVSSTGNRRTQGRVIWLGAAAMTRKREAADLRWAAAVYDATCKRLPLDGADSAGKDAWRKAKERARRLRRVRQ